MSQSATRLAVDVANWAGELKPETLAAWKEAGISLVIVRASTEKTSLIQIAKQQMQAVVEAGFALEAYIWLNWDRPGYEQVKWAHLLYQSFPIGRWWLDVEEADDTGDAGMVRAIIGEAVSECQIRGMATGIYTSRSKWEELVSNTYEFNYLLLWDSRWRMPVFTPYGGFTKAYMTQTDGEVLLGDVRVDLNEVVVNE